MSNAQRKLRGLTAALGSSALTATGAETVHDSTVAMPFSINGKLYSKSGTNADQATPTTDYVTGTAFPVLTGTATLGQGAVVVWAYNSSGTVKCMMGPIEDLDSAGLFLRPAEFPTVPDDVCPFAYMVLKHYASATSVRFGTSNWNATGFTNAIVNIMQLPDRPQIA